MTDRVPQTAAAVEEALRQQYVRRTPGWALLREVTVDDVLALDEHVERMNGIEPSWRPSGTYRRIDVLLIKTSAFAKPIPFERIAVEIKVSRADFRRETAEKRRAWHALAHRFAYAVPKGLISKHEVPPGCGLIEVEHGWPTWTVRAPRRPEGPNAFDDRFVAYLAGRASRAEDRLLREPAVTR